MTPATWNWSKSTWHDKPNRVVPPAHHAASGDFPGLHRERKRDAADAHRRTYRSTDGNPSYLRAGSHRDAHAGRLADQWAGVGQDRVTVANLRRFVSAGGLVALGTDYDGYSCEFNLGLPTIEIGWMQKAGMTPMQIIVAGTRNAAHVCNLDRQLGTLEAGKIADVLVVNGDPLAELSALAKVRLVIHNGVVIRGE
jgi:hypothetical protein